MEFTELGIPGVYLVDLQRHADDRGFFARTYCDDEFAAHGLVAHMPQSSISYNEKQGTLRGMHMQVAPHEEAKLVRVVRGAIHDVIVDMRPDSPTYRRHVAVALDEDNKSGLFVPKGFAHGFLTLADRTEVFYQISTPYAPGFDRGYRYDDPAFAIDWPAPVTVIAPKDAAWPLLDSGAKA